MYRYGPGAPNASAGQMMPSGMDAHGQPPMNSAQGPLYRNAQQSMGGQANEMGSMSNMHMSGMPTQSQYSQQMHFAQNNGNSYAGRMSSNGPAGAQINSMNNGHMVPNGAPSSGPMPGKPMMQMGSQMGGQPYGVMSAQNAQGARPGPGRPSPYPNPNQYMASKRNGAQFAAGNTSAGNGQPQMMPQTGAYSSQSYGANSQQMVRKK